MDRQVDYTLVVDIPYNRETTIFQSNSKEVQRTMLDDCINTIKNYIHSEKYISLEKVFEIMGARAVRACPHIFFTEFDGWEFVDDDESDEETIRLYLTHSFELRPTHKYDRGQYDDETLRENRNNFKLPKKEVEQEWTEKSNDGPKGTSESEENETT